MSEDLHVTLVVDPEFGQRAKLQSRTGPVWVVDSPENTRAIRELWSTETSPYPNAPTCFDAVAGQSPEESAIAFIGTVHEHHPDWQIFEVIGAKLSEILLADLRECAPGWAEETPTGFVFFRARSKSGK